MRASSRVRDEISDPIFSIFSGASTAAMGRRLVARCVRVEEGEPRRKGNAVAFGRDGKQVWGVR